MSIANRVADYDEIPDEILPLAKSHMRVDHAGDDDLIRSKIMEAIGILEQKNDVLINPTTYDWRPSSGDFCNGRARVPGTPVVSFEADAGGDVTADYTIETQAMHGAIPQYLVGAYATGLVVTCTAGYQPALAELAPRMRNRILELAATLYEHREILVDGPAFATELDATDWMPRV